MISAIRKWFAVRSYATRLGPALCARYGKRKHYTPEQVRDTATSDNYNTDYLCYGLSMYCDRISFDAHHVSEGASCDYDTMRSEVSERFFDGSTLFDATHFFESATGWNFDFSGWGERFSDWNDSFNDWSESFSDWGGSSDGFDSGDSSGGDSGCSSSD